jgi:GH15 family glucan-1,4-alpha-glucosidase
VPLPHSPLTRKEAPGLTDMTDTTRGTGNTSLTALANISLDLIVQLQDPSGAYPASPTFSAYKGYAWFRDGAFTADAVSSAGGIESANRFFDWCSRVMLSHTSQIENIITSASAGTPVPDNDMLPARFHLDGTTGDDEWWDFQLDGYGTWLWALHAHAARHELDASRWTDAIDLTVRYLISSWQRPCFDWWEENSNHRHVSTLGCVAAGLRASCNMATLDTDLAHAAEITVEEILDLILTEGTSGGSLAKWLGSNEIDASVIALLGPFGVVDASSPLGLATIERVTQDLVVDDGTHRYRADTFYGGGQWPLLSCFLGLAYAGIGDRARALGFLKWAASAEDPSGSLPEQVPNHLNAPETRDYWIDRWGAVANPLVWSHAMYLKLALALGVASPIEAGTR